MSHMKILKYLSLSVALCLCLNTVLFAADATQANPNFANRKAKIIARIDSRIQALQYFKSCVSSAQNRFQVKKCIQDMKDARNQAMKQVGSSAGQDNR
ncbi:MAG: hypothetical protein HQK89_13160 [Nitrospirae bacterium]|nr:hypothetical protein [Nitrospirota bacterium]